MSGPKDLNEQVYVGVGERWEEKNKEKTFKQSPHCRSGHRSTHKTSQTTFSNRFSTSQKGFGVSLRGCAIIDLGFQSTGPMYHGGYSISRHDE